jgi:hypothetical protein
MRMRLVAVVATFCLMTAAIAQNSPPSQIGNRAHGFDYQPTPREVVPREKATGILPPADQQEATNRDLERMDRDLLRDEGLSTRSVPKLSAGQ